MFLKSVLTAASFSLLAFGSMDAQAQIFRRGNSQQYQPQYQQPQYQQPQAYNQQTVQTQTVQNPNPANSGVQMHWSQKVLENVKRDHDFGVVAKASAQRHVFQFTNNLESDLILNNARVSCGCTKVRIMTPTVKPGEMGQVEAILDTNNYVGQRGATVTVSTQKTSPFNEYGELRFSVKGMIRTDVVFDPGQVDFGPVTQGNPAERIVTIKFAGDPRWEIKQVTSSNPNITGELVETMRDPNSRRVDYQLTIRMSKDQPEGMINDQLLLATNDSNNSAITLPFTAVVERPISVADIDLGLLRVGETYERKLIVKGKQPFEILQVSAADPRLKFEPASGTKTLHILNYQFDAASEGLIKDKIVIKTNDPEQPELAIEFDAQVISETIVNDHIKE